MAKSLMVLGTTSDAGKSLLVAALCRIYAKRGYRVAPFKAQNMGSNSYINDQGQEISRAQAVQAEAAGIRPDARMNPILLKPTGDAKSRVVVLGQAYKDLSARDYYKEKPLLLPKALEAYHSLAGENDIIFLEGAGSPAEINLKEVDIVNMGFAKEVGAPCILVGDIDRGGVFASLAGTLLLFDEEERDLTRGLVINKFRGDQTILDPGLDLLEDLVHKPVLGVVPYLDVDIEDEDSLSQARPRIKREGDLDIGLISLPRLKNFSDTHALSLYPQVSLRQVRLARELKKPDLIIIPGSQNLLQDLRWLRESGLDLRLQKAQEAGIPILGLGTGYYMMLDKIKVGDQEVPGLGLLGGLARIHESAAPGQVAGRLKVQDPSWKSLNGLEARAYIQEDVDLDLEDQSQALILDGRVLGSLGKNTLGTALHGFLDTRDISQALIGGLLTDSGPQAPQDLDLEAYKDLQYETLAQEVEAALDMDQVDKILGIK